MSKALCVSIFCGVLLAALSSGTFLVAQQTANPPAAPIPAQLRTAKKAFISNASGENIIPPGSGDLTYNQFYASMKSWGRYELVAVPADADILLEIHYEASSGWVLPTVEGNGGGSVQIPQIRLIILDPKTRAVLWAFTKPVEQVAKKSTGMQNFQQAMTALIDDLKALTSAANASAPGR